MTDKTQDFEQLSLPLVGERKPTRAAAMRNAQHNAENVQKKAALRAAALRKQTGVDQAKSAIRAAKRVRQQQSLVDQG